MAISVFEWDTELPVTILSCLQNRSGSTDVRIGIAHISTDNGFAKQKQDTPELWEIDNVKIQHFPIKENYGIGRGRNASHSMYSNEDYVLQVDAHTYFSKNWDSDLIAKYESSLLVTKNNKTVMTGIPEGYWYDRNSDYQIKIETSMVDGKDAAMSYPYWLNGWWWVEDAIPRWGNRDPRLVTDNLKRLVLKTGFAPAIKVSGAFMFSNKNVVGHIALDETFIFWEEEIIQSIELIDSGFTLIYPYMRGPIYHMYVLEETEEYGRRASLDDLKSYINEDIDIYKKMERNMRLYFTNEKNHKKIVTYEDYAGIYLGDTYTKRYFRFKESIRRNPYQYANLGGKP